MYINSIKTTTINEHMHKHAKAILFTIAGVQQGSLLAPELAPILFNVYMADMPTSPPNLPRENFNIDMYLDKNLLYSSDHQRMMLPI